MSWDFAGEETYSAIHGISLSTLLWK